MPSSLPPSVSCAGAYPTFSSSLNSSSSPCQSSCSLNLYPAATRPVTPTMHIGAFRSSIYGSSTSQSYTSRPRSPQRGNIKRRVRTHDLRIGGWYDSDSNSSLSSEGEGSCSGGSSDDGSSGLSDSDISEDPDTAPPSNTKESTSSHGHPESGSSEQDSNLPRPPPSRNVSYRNECLNRKTMPSVAFTPSTTARSSPTSAAGKTTDSTAQPPHGVNVQGWRPRRTYQSQPAVPTAATTGYAVSHTPDSSWPSLSFKPSGHKRCSAQSTTCSTRKPVGVVSHRRLISTQGCSNDTVTPGGQPCTALSKSSYTREPTDHSSALISGGSATQGNRTDCYYKPYLHYRDQCTEIDRAVSEKVARATAEIRSSYPSDEQDSLIHQATVSCNAWGAMKRRQANWRYRLSVIDDVSRTMTALSEISETEQSVLDDPTIADHLDRWKGKYCRGLLGPSVFGHSPGQITEATRIALHPLFDQDREGGGSSERKVEEMGGDALLLELALRDAGRAKVTVL